MEIKKTLVFLTFLLLFISCLKTKPSQDIVLADTSLEKIKTNDNYVDTISQLKKNGNNTQKDSIEIFDIDNVKINGKLSLSTNYEEFVKVLGKEDSITNYIGEMYSAFEEGVITKSLYKNNSIYEIYKNKIYYYSIVLNENTFVTYNKCKFTHDTQKKEFAKIFPIASNMGVYINVNNEGEQYMVRLKVSDNPDVDERVNVMFKNDKLIGFHWWLP